MGGWEEKKNLPEYLLNMEINHWLRVSEVFDRPRVNSGVTGDAGEGGTSLCEAGRGGERGENSCDVSV